MIIGTRGSALALAQTKMVMSGIRRIDASIDIEVREIRTMGDDVTDRPLADLGGGGAFVRELDRMVAAGQVDIAVHSMKDMPAVMAEGVQVAAVLERGPVEDVLISDAPLEDLPKGARVGSSSPRRRALLLEARPDLSIVDIRGNVPTRIRKLREGGCDAIVLARAGLERLGIEERWHALDPEVFVPAAGQGAIAVTCRAGSDHHAVLSKLNDRDAFVTAETEREVLRELNAGCSMPIGVLARSEGEGRGVVRLIAAASDGKKIMRTTETLDFGARPRSAVAELRSFLEAG